MMMRFKVFLVYLPLSILCSNIQLGIDNFLTKDNIHKYSKKNIGIITNHTAISNNGVSTIDRLLLQPSLKIKAIFAPEHGLYGNIKAEKYIDNEFYNHNIPIYSIHGKTRRPTKEMLKNIDLLIYDIQDIGCRSYTYISSLFYCMEEAAKYNIEIAVLDRPNPMGGTNFDGPMLENNHRSFIGYINIPYCHGMTICELALLFNKEYNINCNLTCFLMKHWRRDQTFNDTKLPWIPTSPNIPEPDTPFFYATTGCIGELSIVSIGIGTTFPFKVIGAPWINAKKFSSTLNKQQLPGVFFTPFYFTPSFGNNKNNFCKGIKIHITNHKTYKPCKTGNMILGLLKSLYPKEVKNSLTSLKKHNKHMFNLAYGSDKYLSILLNEQFPASKLINEEEKDHKNFSSTKNKYLLYQ